MAEEQFTELQSRLKNILQLLIDTLRPRLKTKSQKAQLQALLLDYHSTEQLACIIENVAKLTRHYEAQSLPAAEDKPDAEDDEYSQLEKSLQTLQARERNYIKNEYQLKLYCEELEAKIRELEVSKNELVISTKKVILDLKRDNQDLLNQIKSLTAIRDQGSGEKSSHRSQPCKNTPPQNDRADRLPKNPNGSNKGESSLKSKLEQYHEVIESIEASRGKKGPSGELRQRYPAQSRQVY